MSTPDPLSQITAAILAHLRQHPHAADTARGIACWWLPEPLGRDVELVSRALDDLLQQGLLQRNINIDQQVIYAGRHKDADLC